MPDPGHGYAKLALRALPGFAWQPGPEGTAAGLRPVEDYGPYLELGGSTYVELGLIPHLALVFHDDVLRGFLLADPGSDAPISHLSTGEPQFGLRASFGQWGPVAVGGEIGVRLPVGDGSPVQDVWRRGDSTVRVGRLTIDSGSRDFIGVLHLGAGLKTGYLAGSVGLIGRSRGYDSVLLWTAEWGRPLGGRMLWQGRVKLGGRHPLGDGTAAYHESPSGLGNGTGYVGFTLELERHLAGPFWLAASLGGGLGPVLRQTGGPALSLGVAAAW